MKNKFLSTEFQSSVRIIENIMGTAAFPFIYIISNQEKIAYWCMCIKVSKHHIIPERARNYDDPAPYKVRLFVLQIFKGPSIYVIFFITDIETM